MIRISKLLLDLRFYLIKLLIGNRVVICNAKFVGGFVMLPMEVDGIIYGNIFTSDWENGVSIMDSSNLPRIAGGMLETVRNDDLNKIKELPNELAKMV